MKPCQQAHHEHGKNSALLCLREKFQLMLHAVIASREDFSSVGLMQLSQRKMQQFSEYKFKSRPTQHLLLSGSHKVAHHQPESVLSNTKIFSKPAQPDQLMSACFC